MRKKQGAEAGLLSLEASITLTIFMFLMFFLYSFFVVFEARNEMAHVLLATADSLALDAYESKELGESGTVSQVIYGLYKKIPNGSNGFTEPGVAYTQDVIRTRFLAYLTGGGDIGEEELLRRYHVKGGVSGLDFSGSYVDDRDNLHLSLKYTLEYEFHVFNGGEVSFEQSVCSKLWK